MLDTAWVEVKVEAAVWETLKYVLQEKKRS